MGSAAALFYSTDPEAQTLHRRIRPSDDQLDSQQAYWKDLEGFLKEELEDVLGLQITHWIQGSYKFSTQIRPSSKGKQFDIDLGIYAHVEDLSAPPHSAVEIKDAVQSALSTYADSPATDALHVEKPKPFCSRIVFSDDFHIDVPGYIENKKNEVLLASSGDGYIESNPWRLYDWWVESFDTAADRDRARRLVRYLKMWASLKFDGEEKPPSSIMLTVLVGQTFQTIDKTFTSGDDEYLLAIAESIKSYLDEHSGAVPNPVQDDEDLNRLGDDYENFATKLKELIATASEAVGEDRQEDSANLWSEIFEHFFPLPDEQTIMESAALAKNTLHNAIIPEVLVEVTLPGGKSYSQKNGALNVPYDSSLNFVLENYDQLPANALVVWTVRNEGSQAEAENDLGHFSGRGRSVGPEHAEYSGRHYMDVVIRSAGQTIGMRRIPVSILGQTLKAKFRKYFGKR